MRPLGPHPIPGPAAPHPCLCGDLTPTPVLGGLLSLTWNVPQTLPGLGSQKQSQGPWDRWWWEGPPRRPWWGGWEAARHLSPLGATGGRTLRSPWPVIEPGSTACASTRARRRGQAGCGPHGCAWSPCHLGAGCQSIRFHSGHLGTSSKAVPPALLPLAPTEGQMRFFGETLTLEGLQAQLGGPQVGGPPGQVSAG